MEADGDDLGAGKGIIARKAMIPASVKAQEVKKPKAVCRRVMVLCILASGEGGW